MAVLRRQAPARLIRGVSMFNYLLYIVEIGSVLLESSFFLQFHDKELCDRNHMFRSSKCHPAVRSLRQIVD